MGKTLLKLRLLLTLTVILVMVSAVCSAGQVSNNDPVEITVLTVNDFHGAMLEEGQNPGLVRLGTYLKQEKSLNADGTIIVSAGDMFQGSAQSNLLYGKPVIEAMNSIGFDAMALGNHEFDWGLGKVEQQAEKARFPFLAANITMKKAGNQFSFYRPYTIVERKGIKIAIIGLTTPETAYKSNPQIVGKLKFNNPAAAVNALVPELKRQGVRMIIVLGHLSCETDKQGIVSGEAAELARQVKGVDLIVAGHSHKRVVGRVNGIPIVQAMFNGRAVGKATFLYSLRENKIISSIISETDDIKPKLPYDNHLTEIAVRTNQELGGLLAKPLGNINTELKHDRYELSLFGQWLTDNMRQTAGADVALLNGGGIRASLPAGKVNFGHIYQALPFDNTLYITKLTGRQIIQALEYSFDNRNIGLLQFSGIKVRYNKANLPGQKVVAVTTLEGALIKPDKIYKVVLNDFLAYGGDGFNMLKGRNGYNTAISLRDVAVNAIRNKQVNFTGDNRLTYASLLIVKAAS